MTARRKRPVLEKAVKLELLEASTSETEVAKGTKEQGKAARRGPPLTQHKEKNAAKAKAEPRTTTVGLLDATLSANVRGKQKGQPIDMGMFRRALEDEQAP